MEYRKKAQFLSLGDGKSGFLYWNFLIVVNPHFPDATPLMEVGAFIIKEMRPIMEYYLAKNKRT